jgi:hypothetical protein
MKPPHKKRKEKMFERNILSCRKKYEKLFCRMRTKGSGSREKNDKEIEEDYRQPLDKIRTTVGFRFSELINYLCVLKLTFE